MSNFYGDAYRYPCHQLRGTKNWVTFSIRHVRGAQNLIFGASHHYAMAVTATSNTEDAVRI